MFSKFILWDRYWHCKEALQLAAYWHPNSFHWHALHVLGAKSSISLYTISRFQYARSFFKYRRKQAGTGPSRRHIQGSKIAKRLPSVKYSFTVLENWNFLKKKFSEKLHTQKNGPSGAPGLASASSWRAKVSQCRKTERGDPLRFFNIHSVAKHEKIEENKNFHFREKISQCRKKTERGDSLGFFNIHSVAKHQKNCKGDPLGKNFFRKKKSRSAEKKMKGGSLWSRPVWYVTRKNRKNLFGSVR